MGEYNEECLKTFLEKQEQLFDEPVAETLEAAEAFLEDCMAVVVESLAEVREYFEENGMDVDGMSEEELEEASEVFALPYLSDRRRISRIKIVVIVKKQLKSHRKDGLWLFCCINPASSIFECL